MNYIKDISKYFLIPITVLVIHFLLLFFTPIYSIFPWLDIPMHLIGGMAVGFTYFFVLNYFEKEKLISLNLFFKALFVISLVILTAVFWEFFEFSLEYLTGMGFQGTLEDTILDLFLGFFGGLFALVFFLKYN